MYEIDPNTASVVRTIMQELPIRTSIAYTQGVLYKTHFSFEQMTVTNRYDGNLLSTPTLIGYKRFDALTGGIGTRGGHRVWIGKKNIQANFGARADSEGVLSGTFYNDLNGNGKHDANEPNIPGRTIYIDLDGDTHQDNNEPTTVTDANGNWSIGGLSYGRYFVQRRRKLNHTRFRAGTLDGLIISTFISQETLSSMTCETCFISAPKQAK